MRILIVGHTYVVPENQKKIQAIATAGTTDVALVVPRRWHDELRGPIDATIMAGASFAAHVLPAWGSGREQFYVYRATDLGLRAFQPDVLLVEQGAGSFVYAQCLLYRRLYAPRAKAVFFTWWNLPYRARWPLRAVERANLRRSQGGVAGNDEAAGILRDHGFDKPLLVLPQLGVDAGTFHPGPADDLRRTLGLARFTVGFVGRFVEGKGLAVLADAMRQARVDGDLLMVGSGPLASDVRAAAASGGWHDRLRIVEAVEHQDVPNYLRAMDVLVLPSIDRPDWKEQFGHVLIEAMACGIPVIGSDAGEIPRVIGDAGLVVPQGDAAALADAISRVAASPALRHDLAEAGLARARTRFTHEGLARQLLDFLGSL